MQAQNHLKNFALIMLATGVVLAPRGAHSQESSGAAGDNRTAALGTIVGIVTSATNAPVARATVTATRADGKSVRATVSGSDGVYSIADLPPGSWVVKSQAAGFPAVSEHSLAVVANQATRFDIVMSSTQVAGAPAATSSSPASHATQLDRPSDSLWTKLVQGVGLFVAPEPQIREAQAGPAAPAAAPAPPPPMQLVPEALQAPDPAPEVDTKTPLANLGDIGWVNGQGREKAPIFDTKFFTPEIRFDVNYLQDTNQPKDHTIDGSTEEFRSGEFQIEQVSFGGNFHWENVQARFLSMMGNFATTTPRNDASSAVGQWDLQGAYKYFSEANAGYHWDVAHGLNVDAGIFVSYIGLFSYYNYDNWTYQPSFVSSNTPWFFNGLRVQYWPTQNLKIEPWLINGWQSYAKFNGLPGFGGQILWMPNSNFKFVANTYSLGQDNLASGSGQPNNGGSPYLAVGLPNPNAPYINYAHVQRFHEDDSVLYRYYENQATPVSKMAFSITWDFGCEYGGGVHCTHGPNMANFLGVMAYNRMWFDHDLFAVTVGSGFMNNPGRYLALVPPINGATAATGSPYFTENPGQKLFQWDADINLQYMPKDWITWWTEATFRHSNVPYWTGSGGITPPLGNTGSPASQTCNNGSVAGADNCAAEGGVWTPDLRLKEIVFGLGVLVKF
jgi:hypothetical protein